MTATLTLSTTLLLCAAAAFSQAPTASGQVLEPPGTFEGQGHRHHADISDGQTPRQNPGQNPAQDLTHSNQPAGKPASQPGPTPADAPAPSSTALQPGLPPSLLDQPPQPAKVDLAAGKLTIHADNSSLTAILNQVSTSAGMTVDGLNRDQRIFGTYGPGDPREILSALLDGTGYNVVMFGRTTAGTPSQLTLSARGANVSSGAPNAARAVQQNQDDEEEEIPQQPPQEAAPPPNAQPGPGVPNNPNGGVRSPQQMLQELQQLRQQQLQQQPQPQQ